MLSRRLLNRGGFRFLSTIKEDKTKLTELLLSSMKISGPLTMAQYVRMCLLHPQYGYYMKNDVFGTKGDFITSPEISQMFGELLAVWFVHHHLQSTKDRKFQLVELGPGRGTLMFDMLNSLKQFPTIYEKIDKVVLVDQSLYMQKIQKDKLSPFSELNFQWHDRLQDVPLDYSYYVAHEFYDALPCFQFQKTDDGFREVVVDINDGEDQEHFRPVLAPSETKSLLLLEGQDYSDCKTGDIVQISPDVMDVSSLLTRRVNENGGAALIIDYGTEKIRSNTLRGIKDHQFISPFAEPGAVDLSFDVEFDAIKSAVLKQNGHFHGPVEQSYFLQRMGIGARLMSLLSSLKTTEERKTLYEAYERLISPDKMGKAYKFAAITNSPQTPYAFEKSN